MNKQSKSPSDKVGDSPEVTQAKVRVAHLQKLTELMDGYAKNPSNSNKWRYRMDAYIDSVVHQKQVEAQIDELRYWAKLMKLNKPNNGGIPVSIKRAYEVRISHLRKQI